jgi:hypothetical protein
VLAGVVAHEREHDLVPRRAQHPYSSPAIPPPDSAPDSGPAAGRQRGARGERGGSAWVPSAPKIILRTCVRLSCGSSCPEAGPHRQRTCPRRTLQHGCTDAACARANRCLSFPAPRASPYRTNAAPRRQQPLYAHWRQQPLYTHGSHLDAVHCLELVAHVDEPARLCGAVRNKLLRPKGTASQAADAATSLSLSLSFSHTHTHTHRERERERERESNPPLRTSTVMPWPDSCRRSKTPTPHWTGARSSQ